MFLKKSVEEVGQVSITKVIENDTREKITTLEKRGRSKIEKGETNDYLKNLPAHDARTIFVQRSSMTRYVKLNYIQGTLRKIQSNQL